MNLAAAAEEDASSFWSDLQICRVCAAAAAAAAHLPIRVNGMIPISGTAHKVWVRHGPLLLQGSENGRIMIHLISQGCQKFCLRNRET